MNDSDLMKHFVVPGLKEYMEVLDGDSIRQADVSVISFLPSIRLTKVKVGLINKYFVEFYNEIQNSMRANNITFEVALKVSLDVERNPIQNLTTNIVQLEQEEVTAGRERRKILREKISNLTVELWKATSPFHKLVNEICKGSMVIKEDYLMSPEVVRKHWKRMFEDYQRQQEYRSLLPPLLLRQIEEVISPVVIEKKRGNTADAVRGLSDFLNTLKLSDASNVQKQNQMTEYLKNLGINLQGDKIEELFKRLCSQMKEVYTPAEGEMRKPDEGKVLLYLAEWPKSIRERKLEPDQMKLEFDQMKLFIDMHLRKYVSNTLLNNVFKALEEPSKFEKALEHARNPQNKWPPADVQADPFYELIVYLSVLKENKVDVESAELLERIRVCINKLGFDLKNDEIDNILQQVPRLSPANRTPEAKLETKKDDNISQQVPSGSPGSLTSTTEGARLLSGGGLFSRHSLSSKHDIEMRPQSPSNASLSQASSDNSHTRPESPSDMSRSDSGSVPSHNESIDISNKVDDIDDNVVLPPSKSPGSHG